jgi:molecular chaperone GrpE
MVAKEKETVAGETVEITGEELEESPEGTSGEAVNGVVETELDRLQKDLLETKAQAAEYLDGWQRAQAEFANFRKRKEAERFQVTERANAALLLKMLPVVDDFERAISVVPEVVAEADWVEGMMLVKRKLDGILETEGVKPFECEGEAFDPRYHDAVAYEEVEGYEEGQVFEELQRGYLFGDRVLRPALVRVAKASTATPDDTEMTKEDKE